MKDENIGRAVKDSVQTFYPLTEGEKKEMAKKFRKQSKETKADRRIKRKKKKVKKALKALKKICQKRLFLLTEYKLN